MLEQDRPRRLSRRAFIQAGLLGVGAAALWPVSAPVAKPRDVPRNRTLTLVWTGREGRWVDHELWNPYAIGANHQSGPGIFYEPLAYYSAFADKEYRLLSRDGKSSEQFTYFNRRYHDEGIVRPRGNRVLNDVRCESRGGDLGGFSIHGGP